MYLLAKIDGSNLIKTAGDNADAIAQGFNDLWGQSLSGDLYKSMCDLGALFAIATLTFFMIEWTKKMMNGDEQRAFTDFIWPVIVVSLLANNGKILGNSTLGIRNYINNINSIVLQSTAAGINLREAFSQALGTEAARSAIGLAINRCQNSSLKGQESIDCLEQAKQDLSTKYPQQFQKNGGSFGWFIDAVDNIVQAPIDAIKDGKNPLEIILSSTNALIGSTLTDVISVILIGMNGAFQWGIELTLLVTAFLGPIAVGGSLLPYGAKSIYTWLTGYFSVGMAKLCFNIIVGFAGQLIADSKTYQPMFFLFTIGLIAPFLATGLAAGGGIAVLTQINKAAEIYSSIAIDVSKAIVTKGASLANKFK